MQELMDNAMEYAPNLIAALLLTVLFAVAVLLVRKVFTSGPAARKFPSTVQNLLARASQAAIIIIGVLTILDQLGVNVTSMVAGLGVAGLALSLAAQDTIANIIAGITILVDRPFREGDWIEVNGMHTSVTAIRLRTTVLTSFDNETVVMPNSSLAQASIVNYTYTPRIRVHVPIRIAYKEDVEKARKVLLDTARDDERVLREPAPLVCVTELAESSVNLELRFWIEDSADKYPLTWEYMETCKLAFDNAGIHIPFPHREVFQSKREKVVDRENKAASSTNKKGLNHERFDCI